MLLWQSQTCLIIVLPLHLEALADPVLGLYFKDV